MNDDADQPDQPRSARPPTDLIVAPTRIGDRRRLRQPGILAAIVAVAFVSVAAWKPWDRPASGLGPSPRASSGPVASTPGGVAVASGASLDPGGLQPNPFAPFPSKATLLRATSRQLEWGIRALVVREGPPAYEGEPAVVERWVAAGGAGPTEPSPSPDAGSPASSPWPSILTISHATDEVAAIGITTADDALALDVRIWRLDGSLAPQRLAPFGIVGPEAGSWLWLPDPRHATAAGMWPAGTYAIDALLGPRIVRLVATIPDSAPEVAPTPAQLEDRPLNELLSGIEPGLVALADGAAQHVVGGQPPVADERSAWLGPAAGLPAPARIGSDAVTGFGWIGAPGENLVSIDAQALTPGAPPVELSDVRLGVGPVGRPAVVGRTTLVPTVPSGLYRITTVIDDGTGPRTEVATVEIVPPGLQSPPLSPLEAMSRWVGSIGPPDPAAPLPLVFIDDAAESSSECSPATAITAADAMFGIVLPPGVTLTRLRMLPENVTQSADIPVRYAPAALPRLTLVALPSEGLPIRDDDLFLTLESATGGTRIALRICVGPAR